MRRCWPIFWLRRAGVRHQRSAKACADRRRSACSIAGKARRAARPARWKVLRTAGHGWRGEPTVSVTGNGRWTWPALNCRARRSCSITVGSDVRVRRWRGRFLVPKTEIDLQLHARSSTAILCPQVCGESLDSGRRCGDGSGSAVG